MKKRVLVSIGEHGAELRNGVQAPCRHPFPRCRPAGERPSYLQTHTLAHSALRITWPRNAPKMRTPTTATAQIAQFFRNPRAPEYSDATAKAAANATTTSAGAIT